MYRFAEWIAQHVHMQIGQEAACVSWSCALLLEAETRVPLAETTSESGAEVVLTWTERSMEFLELDAATVRVVQMWRSLLDLTGDGLVVQHIVASLLTLLTHKSCDEELHLRPIVLKRLQPHFVDIADVLIGWAMNTGAVSLLK